MLRHRRALHFRTRETRAPVNYAAEVVKEIAESEAARVVKVLERRGEEYRCLTERGDEEWIEVS